jgi:transcriptional regulator with XRE-family HTH domain
MNLGQTVRDYRQKAGMTQLQLSKKLGYESMQFVSLMERGLSKIPLKTLGQLIVILKLPEIKITQQLIQQEQKKLLSEIRVGKESMK